ncbi:MAG TPA: hypothetical protein VLH79_00200 [Chthonomonadales bacterium]|nr:hypothetical protein [Chthonomonadales bacterium]
MSDPINAITRWSSWRPQYTVQVPVAAIVEPRDRVAYAVARIRDSELALWYEPDWRSAEAIAGGCPSCVVFSVPPEATLMRRLDGPPPWRATRHNVGEV